jgi:Na+-driven multidrug efflux pump
VLRQILGLAWPILIVQLAVMAYAFIDTLLTGHATPADLAAMGVGASVYGSVFVSLTGVLNALNPIMAQDYGAGRDSAVGASFVQGVWLALLLSAAGMPVLALPQLWLPYLNAAADVQELVTGYLRVLSLSLPATLLLRAVYAFNTAISRPKVIMALMLGGLVLKIGARDLARARTIGFAGMVVCVAAASLNAGGVWALRGAVVGLYTSEAAVATVALSLIGYFAALHVFDALQGVTAFLLRAYRIAVVPTVIYALALWGPGLIGGYLVAFGPLLGGPRGVQGLWLMLALSLALTATLLVAFYLWVVRRQAMTYAIAPSGSSEA